MDINYYKKYEPIDGKWYITRELGSGAFGKVFEIERKDFTMAKSALKIITIPSSQSEVASYREENFDLDEKSVSSYFYGFVEEFTKEFELMLQLKGKSNIVSIEDFDVKKHTEGVGWDLFIRMELLTPMNKYFIENAPKTRDVIKLGIDICKALEVCQKYNIVHRDIKPSNIFVSQDGEFKLGDFGVARTLEKTSSGLSKKGTYTYMAPEVYRGDAYGSNVDIYSLGIVMYKLLNNNKEPFKIGRTHEDEENALVARMKNTPMPAPENADGRLAEIILKACAFEPKDRYESPARMREELEAILYSENEEKLIFPQGDKLEYEPSDIPEKEDKTSGLFDEKKKVVDEEFVDEPTLGIFDEDVSKDEDKKKNPPAKEEEKKPSGKLSAKGIITICGIVLLLVIAIIWGTVTQDASTVPSTVKETNEFTTVVEPKIISISTGVNHTIGLKEDGTVVATGNNEHGECGVLDWTNIISISAGHVHTVGLKNDGTVVAVGNNEYGQCNVENWSDIKSISAVGYQTIGLKEDGTVVATGDNEYGQCDTQSWSNIVSIYAEYMQTTGLKSDGTIVVAGDNDWGQKNVTSWRNIKEVCGGNGQTVGLKNDGTVVAVGWNDYGQCNTQGWSNIAAIYMDNARTIGLRTDGTVVATGANLDDIGNVKNWTEIRKIYLSDFTTIGLKNDGTAIATGLNEYGECNVHDWNDIIEISLGRNHTVGLKSDGTVVAVGDNSYGQCDVLDW